MRTDDEFKMSALSIVENLPGEGMIRKGMKDLDSGLRTVESLLIMIAWDDLKRNGLPITRELPLEADGEILLYDLLRASGELDAYSKYNSLIRELVSFQRALRHRYRRLVV